VRVAAGAAALVALGGFAAHVAVLAAGAAATMPGRIAPALAHLARSSC
jgi:hypothetical protein